MLSKILEKFLGITPILEPRRAVSLKKNTPSTTYDPTFLVQNPFLLEKYGYLQNKGSELNMTRFDMMV